MSVKSVFPGGLPSPTRMPWQRDAGAEGALNLLYARNRGPGSISGQEMLQAILQGTADLDGQAAGSEFETFKSFVNWDGSRSGEQLLSPEAKQVFSIYAKYAEAARARGESGISPGDFQRMTTEMQAAAPALSFPTGPNGPGPTGPFIPNFPGSFGYDPRGPFMPPMGGDAGALAALNQLARQNTLPGSVSGQEMTETILKATRDLDGQAAGAEYEDIKRFAVHNWHLLSPEAKEAFSVYQQAAEAARARGTTSIDVRSYRKMAKDMRAVSTPKYQDAGAGAALRQLAAKNKRAGSISGKELADAIVKATKDRDGQAAGRELADIKKFAAENSHLLSPAAKRVLAAYEKHAQVALAKGQTGIPLRDYQRMVREMMRASGPAVARRG
ncbi:MAG: hypothetical protein ACOZIN_22415 [Myxococcota bacterium]